MSRAVFVLVDDEWLAALERLVTIRHPQRDEERTSIQPVACTLARPSFTAHAPHAAPPAVDPPHD